jgi:enamine deaminase RidA (YjgF/YER057c/UK114 family)
MSIDRIDPPSLAMIPGCVHVTVTSGNRIIHVSGQTGVDTSGKVVGSTHLEQSRQALRNLRTALDAAGVGLGDIAKVMIHVVDYSEAALEALMVAVVEEWGDDYPMSAATLVGVAALWQPDLLIEIDAVAVA